jgi:hypothetical protein
MRPPITVKSSRAHSVAKTEYVQVPPLCSLRLRGELLCSRLRRGNELEVFGPARPALIEIYCRRRR